MDNIIGYMLGLLMDNLVFVVLIVGVFVLIRIIAKNLLPLIGGIFVAGLLIYGFTGDDTFLNRTIDTSTQAVNIVKDEVETAEFKRTSETTFEVTTRTLKVTGDETTKLAKVTTAGKTVDIPLSSLYKLLSEDIQKQINM